MKQRPSFLFGCALALLSGAGASSHAQGDGTPESSLPEVLAANLAQNGSFENDTAFWVLPTGARVDKGEAHIGSAALHVTNGAPTQNGTRAQNHTRAQNRAATQFIPVAPGDRLIASAWIKGRSTNLGNANQGTTIAIEAYDTNGARLGGETSPANSGTFDWKRVSVNYRVPPNADKVFLRLTPGEGTIGDVWFDDTTVTLVPGDLEGANLLPDSGFEIGTSNFEIYAVHKDLFQRDSQIKHSGAYSLRASNDDPEIYLSTSQKLSLSAFKPGDILHTSTWIKGENITPTDGNYGVGIYIEFYDVNNKWLAGNYPPPLKGTFDWTQVSGKLVVPAGAARAIFGVYQRRNTIGTAWFDDISLKVEAQTPLRMYFQTPNYRGLTLGRERTWSARAQVNPAPDWTSATLPVESRIFDAAGKTVAGETLNIPATSGEHPISVTPPANLSNGAYFWRLTYKDTAGKIEHFQQPLLKTAAVPTVGIDAEGFTVANGKRFFPLGLYLAKGTNSAEDLERIAKAGYNTVLSYSYGLDKDYEAFLDLAQRNNLKVVFALKDMLIARPGLDQAALDDMVTDRVVKLRDKPALLAWYINDERPIAYVPILERIYTRVKALDPNHPAYQVLGETRYLDHYYSSSDILGTDPYPVGKGDDLVLTTQWTQDTVNAARQSKGVWMVPQVMDHGVYSDKNPSHTPSLQEMRNQAYQAIIAGAKGLIFYSYFDLYYADPQRQLKRAALEKRWPDVTQLATEVNSLIPAVLDGTPVPLGLPATARVRASAIRFNNQLLVLVANPYSSAESITFDIPAGWKLTKAQQNEVKGALQSNALTLSLPSLGSGVFALDPA